MSIASSFLTIYCEIVLTDFVLPINSLNPQPGGGRVVSASGSETIVSSSMPTSAIICDAYASIIKVTIE